MPGIAIIGSGPTAIYTLAHLIAAPEPLDVTIFERQAQAGWGTPYSPALNSPAMLANIASIEIPPIAETLVGWLERQPDAELQRMNVPRGRINDREFFPRLVLGEFFAAQFRAVLALAAERGHSVSVKTGHSVADIVLDEDDIRLAVEANEAEPAWYGFDHVVMATGHSWSDATEKKPGYFSSPWPVSQLSSIGNVHLGIRGTSLSAIDALVSVASNHGTFLADAAGVLQYFPHPGTEGFRATLMSRKGLLPEADFFHPLPYQPLGVCTEEAVEALIASGRADLLDAVFDLFRQELAAADPAYAEKIGLGMLTVESFSAAYFHERETRDPFTWAALNLNEAKANFAAEYTVPWRYAILRMHEVIGPVVPHLNAEDFERFNKHFKHIFVDEYATVPHESIERLLALHRAGKLDILKLGSDYDLNTDGPEPGAVLTLNGGTTHFPAFVEATGQKTKSAADIPFPSLKEPGLLRPARAAHKLLAIAGQEEAEETGGIALDEAFRPLLLQPLCNRLYCLSLPFLLAQFPFVQGITSSAELGAVVAEAIRRELNPAAISSVLGDIELVAA